jgi:hypothetical protein
MNVGMMWFDNDPKISLTAKIEKAANYYYHKYGHSPNVCLVHPDMLPETDFETGQIVVRPYRSVLPGHLWIGVEENHE